MCRSAAEGGQRCFGGAKDRAVKASRGYVDASKAYEAARRDYNASLEAVTAARTPEARESANAAFDAAHQRLTETALERTEARGQHVQALTDLASTPQGAAEIAAMRDAYAAHGDDDRVREYEAILWQGGQQRDRAALIKMAHDARQAEKAGQPA